MSYVSFTFNYCIDTVILITIYIQLTNVIIRVIIFKFILLHNFDICVVGYRQLRTKVDVITNYIGQTLVIGYW